jgi:hypothetical protein
MVVAACLIHFDLGRVLINPRCPLFPRKRTLLSAIAMSALCQKQTSASYSITCRLSQAAAAAEVAIAIFILLCGLAVAAFLGMKRVRG